MELGILIKIALVGLLAWGICEIVPMPAHVKKVIYVVAVLIAVLIALPVLEALFARL